VWASLTAGDGEGVVAGVGIGAAAVLLVALVGRWRELLPWAIALLGAQYAVALLIRSGEIDGLAPLYAAALFATAELAYWAFERGPAGRAVISRLAGLLAQALGAGAAAAAVLAISAGGGDGGLAIQALGLIAAATAVGLVTWLAWRSRTD
jgi:hypothetical protein